MQCSANVVHCACSTFSPQTLSTKTFSFQFHPTFNLTSQNQQQQHKITYPQPPEQRRTCSDGYGNSKKVITSVSNPFVKHCLKLRNSSSYRRSHGSVLVVGSTPIREIYRFQDSFQDENITMECLILLDKAEISSGLDKSAASIVHASPTVMKKISGLQSTDSTDAIAIMKIPASFLNVDDHQKKEDCKKWFLSTHRILDPGNLGTLLRSAVAFRWDGVFLLPGSCDPFNEKALRASRGASFQLPIVSGSWSHLDSLIEEFQMKLLAGHPEHEGEGSGLSEKSLQACELVSIAMAGEYESLNVSVAGGIFLYMLQPNNT
ncbi:hypothetical protein Ahy_A03g011205 isoform A [Arachis hypogaea]|uniref:tRNA/rRNA methyltransferase SpoU type domain-containing protein n=1 Tax=Arachis hypogaea TaxID=3818 RepID=A0A445DQ07_ARAHY|nr:hypothetical protein Ahy_A03g011205 isoform A [Arachis hypogaea]